MFSLLQLYFLFNTSKINVTVFVTFIKIVTFFKINIITDYILPVITPNK